MAGAPPDIAKDSGRPGCISVRPGMDGGKRACPLQGYARPPCAARAGPHTDAPAMCGRTAPAVARCFRDKVAPPVRREHGKGLRLLAW